MFRVPFDASRFVYRVFSFKNLKIPVSNSTASVGLSSLAELEGLATEGALVDLALRRTGERHPVVVEFDDSVGRLACHVVNRILLLGTTINKKQSKPVFHCWA